jgi:hypothetical protein
MSIIDNSTAVMDVVHAKNELKTPDVKFHDHLEVCEQCREHPFDLCPRGHILLMAVGDMS